MRLLYSSNEIINCILGDIALSIDIGSELCRYEENKVQVRRLTSQNLGIAFQKVYTQVYDCLSDSHLVLLEAFQVRLINTLEDMKLMFRPLFGPGLPADKTVEILQALVKKFRDLDLGLKCISNC